MHNPNILVLARFAKHFQILPSGCWQFDMLNSTGYGYFGYLGKNLRAHRWLYQVVQRIKLNKKQQLDHLCRNRDCVNPKHLEIVDNRTNVLRGTGGPAVNALKTHCKWGHEFNEENTRWAKTGSRVCRPCERTSLSKKRREARLNK